VDLTAVGAIVVSSGDGFQAASRLWFGAKRPAGVPVFAPSKRVADMGPQLGFGNVIICRGADPVSVIEALRRRLEFEGTSST
jgi:uroporphyrinogen-III synthase